MKKLTNQISERLLKRAKPKESIQEWRYRMGIDPRPEPEPAYIAPPPSVYFVEDGDAIKIGYGGHPTTRLGGLQVGNPRPLTLLGSYHATLADEKTLHDRFSTHWIRGEWFRDNPELRELIATRCLAPDVEAA